MAIGYYPIWPVFLQRVAKGEILITHEFEKIHASRIEMEKIQISLVLKVTGKSRGFHKMKEKNSLSAYILGSKSHLTLVLKFKNRARRSVKNNASYTNFGLNYASRTKL